MFHPPHPPRDGCRSVYFWAIRSPSPVQNQLSLAQVDFSLFVLELPIPNRKAEVIFPLFVLELPLPNRKEEVRISLFVLELPLPNRKSEVGVPYSFCNLRSQIEKPKSNFSLFDWEICEANTQTFHSAFWNFTPKSKTGSPSCTIRSGTRSKNRSRSSTFRFGKFCSQIEMPKFEWTRQARKNRPASWRLQS